MQFSVEPFLDELRWIATALSFLTLCYVGLRSRQNNRENWSIFYSGLWSLVLLPVVNYACVTYNFWCFSESNTLVKMPLDIFFIWWCIWGILPTLLFKGRFIAIQAIVMVWLDILIMPIFDQAQLFRLNAHWWIGELLMIGWVFLPGQIWANLWLQRKHTGLRAVFQVVVMVVLFLAVVPQLLIHYKLLQPIALQINPYLSQIVLILGFPGLFATYQLVTQGKGTPFPYDSTHKLVQDGIYAYIKNPIQWSFTLLFVPMAFYYQSIYFLLGSLVSIAYAYGISDFQEYPDLVKRFGGKYKQYTNNTPKWYFQWKPKKHPRGEIFFNSDCDQCSQLGLWFKKKTGTELQVTFLNQCAQKGIQQVTYIDANGDSFKSVKAIAKAFNHIHLGYATLGWFLLTPIISQVVQLMVDLFDFTDQSTQSSKVKKMNS